jgi:hypothetical protein
MFETFPLPDHALDTFQCGEQADASRFRRLHIWGNGSCFFHSVACLLCCRNVETKEAIQFYLAIPSDKNLAAKPTLKRTELCFPVPRKYPAQKFHRHFEQVGIQLRRYLSQTLTEDRYRTFCKQAFSSGTAWALAEKAPSWIDVKTKMAEPSKWADIWVVKYAAWALSLNLLFINGTSREEPIFCGVENFENGPWTLFIFWSGKVHFEPIVELAPGSPDKPILSHRIFLTSHPFIRCLKDRYESSLRGGCRLPVNHKIA